MLDQIERDLKTALLAGDKDKVETLKTLKSAIQYEAGNKSIKPDAFSDEQLQVIAARESKKRQEAADLYKNAGEQERSARELSEKAIIDAYLPSQMSEEELQEIIKEELSKTESLSASDMGRIIGAVKARVGAAADGSVIARLVKQSLEQSSK
ncbi:MAG: hypothetical protein JWO96_372 [Candidatus Saccharibacteria bacterium]|nr:hypothetical protein [Candidatus Saccharibacteria bacterium]